MKIFSFVPIALCISIAGYAQIKSYDNSFIKFHEYGQGKPVIILSGGPGNDCRQEEDVALQVSARYHAILLEQRGTGLSMPKKPDENSISLEYSIEDILFVMDSLKIQQAILYGHSWGALLAVSFAVKYPEKVKSLILTGPGPMHMNAKSWNQIPQNRLSKLTPGQQKRYWQLFGKSQKNDITGQETAELSFLKNTMNVYDTTNTEQVFPKINKGVNNPVTYNLMIKDLYKIKFNLTDKISELAIPITVITGKQDPLAFLTDEFHIFCPKAKVLWIDKSGHFPMFEQPDEFYATLMKVLD